MEEIEFFKIYIPALESALANDSKNLGYHVKGPEDFVDERYLEDLDKFIQVNSLYAEFIDEVGYYFDAKSHYVTKIASKDIDRYRQDLLDYIAVLKNKFNIK